MKGSVVEGSHGEAAKLPKPREGRWAWWGSCPVPSQPTAQPKSTQTKPSSKLNCSPRVLPGFQAHEEEMSQAGAASLQRVSPSFGQSELKINYLFLL